LILMLIWFFSGARSCTDDGNIRLQNEEQLLSESRDSIRQAFEVETPDDKLLRAFETIAKQKLIDLTDYLKIASDSSLDTIFRIQAIEMAGNLFIYSRVDTMKHDKANLLTKLRILNKLTGKDLFSVMPCTADPDQIILKTPLTLKNDSTFTGRLSYYQKCNPSYNTDLQETLVKTVSVDFYALKVVKSFGKERFHLWEVYLGDIF
jgi:hypothetical protein